MPAQRIREAEAMQEQIAQLMEEVTRLKGIVEGQSSIGPRRPLWSIIREYLIGSGPSSPEDITKALMNDGHNLGKYPLRSVKITVTSPKVKGVFKVVTNATGDETVHLTEKRVTFKPQKWVSKKPVRKSSR